MKETTFSRYGATFTLTRDQVIEAHKDLQGEHVREYAVEIDGRYYSVRKAMARALGVTNAEVGNTHQCVREFKKLGFPTKQVLPV